jgi:hypothetical protein
MALCNGAEGGGHSERAGCGEVRSKPTLYVPNKVLAAEYQTVLLDEKLIADEIDLSRFELEKRGIQTK